MRTSSSIIAAIATVVLLGGACASSGTGPSGAEATKQVAVPVSNASAAAIEPSADPPAAVDPGSSALTIGDQMWTFDNYSCAFGHEATRSDTFSFSSVSDAFNDQGRTLYMLVEIDDETGQDRYDGDGVSYDISIVDLQHPDAPEVDFGSRQGTTVHIDGDRVTAEGTFDDFATDGSEEIPGSFEGTCGSRSRR